MHSYQSLKDFAERVFRRLGCPVADAQTAATVLLAADLRGVDSHGVARLSGYVRLWENDRLNPRPNPQVTHETPSTAVVDGDGGLGLVVAPYAMRVAIRKAREVGTGWVSVRNSNHFGVAGQHAMQALPFDMIGWAMTNASPLVAPTYATDRLLGTNPIALAVPAGQEPPFVADFATTTAANGKLEMLQRQQRPAPVGWLQTADGSPTTNPSGVREGGALLPLGGDRDHGSHKGYCLGAMVDVLSAVLSGANYGPWVPPFVSFIAPAEDPVGEGIGHFLGAMRVDAFRPVAEFKRHMDQWIRTFRAANTTAEADRVLVPGDPERETEAQRRAEGIPLLPAVVEDLTALAERLKVSFGG